VYAVCFSLGRSAIVNVEITDRQFRAFKRFVKLLPHGRELDLVVVKGHLLIVEQMNLLIDDA
jgi:hypothetical protein